MDVLSACVIIIYCKSVYGGFHGGLLVVYCGPGNCSSIVRVCGLSWVVGVVSRMGELEKSILGESVLVGCVFSDKYSMVHVSLKSIKDGVYVVFSIDN